MIIALVAGEASGDQLGAALIQALKKNNSETRFTGIGGPLMAAAGMECWWDTGELSVMGLAEVVSHLPRLFRLRSALIKRLLDSKPDVFIGIDAPDFNLGVEKRLKANKIPVIHYVSPTVWAWRAGRVKSIAKATDRVMCLFPFEPQYYQQQPIIADYTGHPLADEIPLEVNSTPAGHALGIEAGGPVIALLPGSRLSEVEKLARPMLDAADELSRKYPGVCFLIPAATQPIRQHLDTLLREHPQSNCQLFDTRGKEVMAASDIVICASGTATLEVMLVNRPMVVCYRLSAMTFRMAMWFKLVKSRFFSLPNIISQQALVPELLQDEVSGQRIAQEVSRWLDHPDQCEKLKQRFDELHRQLRKDAAASAANVVCEHIMNSKKPNAT